MPIAHLPRLQMHYDHVPAVHQQTYGVQNPSDGTGFESGGQRPALLMLSGMASDSASWQPVMDGLSESQDLIIPDNRHTGRTRVLTSDKPVRSSREQMVDDLLSLLDLLQIDRIRVLGHSMGGMLGWALACRAPDRVAHLISVAALPTLLPARLALFRSLAALRSEHNEREWFALLYQFLFKATLFDDDSRVQAALDGSMNYPYKQSVENFDLQVRSLESFTSELPLQHMACPVTLIAGSDDVLMPPRMMQSFIDDCPTVDHLDIELRIIDGAAHAMHWEQTEQFVAMIP